MYAKVILNFIRGKTVDFATKKIERQYREKYSASAEAFRFLEKDVKTVLEMVYQYHAQILIAQDILSTPLVNNADYLSVCGRVPKRRELEDLEELIREVENMITESSGLRSQVRARVLNHIETSEAQLAALREELRAQESNGADFQLLRYTAVAINRVSGSRDRARVNKLTIERTGNEIDEQLYEALALLENVMTRVRYSQDGFATIVKDCNVWMNNWNQWDYNRRLGRGAQ